MISSLFKRRTPRLAVAVFDAHAPAGLAFTRQLGVHGVPVHAYSAWPWAAARLSRFCNHFARCPNPADAEVFLPWLRREVDKGKIELVAPTSDLMAFYMGEFPECFPADQHRGMPTREATATALLKDRFNAACEAQGVRTPWALCPTSRTEALDVSASLPYPVILKPRAHLGLDSNHRGVVVHSDVELLRHYDAYPIPPHRQVIMERYPELRWPMIQEYIPEALEHLYSISGLCDQNSQVVGWIGSRKTVQWPRALGTGLAFESWHDEEPIQMGLELVRKVLKTGIFELELIYDRRIDDYVAIDLNPRAHGHIRFDIARNNDLPIWWYCMSRGDSIPSREATRSDMRWLHSVPYHVGQALQIVRGPNRGEVASRYMGSLRGPSVDVVNDLADPLPSFAHVAQLLRNPRGLLHPYMRK